MQESTDNPGTKILHTGTETPHTGTDTKHIHTHHPKRERYAVMLYSTIGFTAFFAVWVTFAICGIPIRKEFGLTESQLAMLMSASILSGSILRLNFGIWADQFGGKRVFTLLFLLTAVPCYLFSQMPQASEGGTYNTLLLYSFLIGLAGNSFAIGIAWTSAWFPKNEQGFALGVFGAGNVGASITKLLAPTLVILIPITGIGFIPGGWRFVPFIYSIMLLVTAAIIWFGTPSHDRKPAKGRGFLELLKPLKSIRTWRFGLYYIVVFGAYVAYSFWLPKYYVDVFGLDLKIAGILTAVFFVFPASLLRPLGGWFSDKFGARRIMYWVFGGMLIATLFLSMPDGYITVAVPQKFNPNGEIDILHYSMTVWSFTILIFIVGVGMGIGKAAVYRYIPDYFPDDVGAVGGLVGLLGAMGAFFMPPIFAWSLVKTGLPQTAFFVLFLITAISFIWMHLVVLQLLGEAAPKLKDEFELYR